MPAQRIPVTMPEAPVVPQQPVSTPVVVAEEEPALHSSVNGYKVPPCGIEADT